jgi:hypothetical protein
MNALEQLLSDTADYAEALLRQRPEADKELLAALANGQHPSVIRLIAPGIGLVIAFQTS